MVVETFGPFVIPAVIFAVGVVFYALVIVVSQWRRAQSDAREGRDDSNDHSRDDVFDE